MMLRENHKYFLNIKHLFMQIFNKTFQIIMPCPYRILFSLGCHVLIYKIHNLLLPNNWCCFVLAVCFVLERGTIFEIVSGSK